MPVFRVTVRGEGLRIKFEDMEAACGFYKNEYIWARHADRAIEKAKAAVFVQIQLPSGAILAGRRSQLADHKNQLHFGVCPVVRRPELCIISGEFQQTAKGYCWTI